MIYIKSKISPINSGYYLAKYTIPNVKGIFYKPIFFSAHKNRWLDYRNESRKIKIIEYVKETRSDFYTDCIKK